MWRPAARCATGLTDLPHFSRVVSLIWRRPGRHTDGRVILTAQGSQLVRTGGCDLPQLADRVLLLAVGAISARVISGVFCRGDSHCGGHAQLPTRGRLSNRPHQNDGQQRAVN